MQETKGSFGPHIQYSISKDLLHLIFDDYEILDMVSDLFVDLDGEPGLIWYDFESSTHGKLSMFIRHSSGFEKFLAVLGSLSQENIERIFHINDGPRQIKTQNVGGGRTFEARNQMRNIEEKNYPGFRRDWRLRWLKSIAELSDIQLQKDKWLDYENSNPHWSYVEFMCCYFDDLAIKDDADGDYVGVIDEKFVSPDEFAILRNWHNRISKYQEPDGSNANPELIILDEEWNTITSMGEMVLENLIPSLHEQEKLQVRQFLENRKREKTRT